MADDPCATLAALQAAKISLLTGQQTTRVKIENFEVYYSQIDGAALDAAIMKYDGLCAKSTHQKPRRFAIRAGTPWYFRRFIR
jgi:hypothetical protein